MKMPVLFVGHGSPMNALEQNRFTETLAGLAERLPRPQAVRAFSAHRVTRGCEVLAVLQASAPFMIFTVSPRRSIKSSTPRRARPRKPSAWRASLKSGRMKRGDPIRGRVERPAASVSASEVPVFQVSLDQGRSLARHLNWACELAGLRDRGVLILGSGNIVDNLRRLEGERTPGPFPGRWNLTRT